MSLPKVAVAMSGGVDSSVAAALLMERGYPVIGMMLRLWSEPGWEDSNRCCTPDAMAQARLVASILNIPFYAIDARQRFRETVVETFLDGYSSGITPNPCLVCNRDIRWGVMLNHANALGADRMATGHYARLADKPDGSVQLLRGFDKNKDQAYVLSGLSQHQLQRSLFPVGEYEKPAIRELAKKYGLPVADRPDSQDLCFLAGQDYRSFLKRNAPDSLKQGKIVNRDGKHLGEHLGLAFYTIGQRKGLSIAASEPLYVLEKRITENTLVVGTVKELGRQELNAVYFNWISGVAPHEYFPAEIKIRYKAELVRGMVFPEGEHRVKIEFERPLRDITPGQLSVIYDGDIVLGSGIIENPSEEGIK